MQNTDVEQQKTEQHAYKCHNYIKLVLDYLHVVNNLKRVIKGTGGSRASPRLSLLSTLFEIGIVT